MAAQNGHRNSQTLIWLSSILDHVWFRSLCGLIYLKQDEVDDQIF